MKTTFCCLLLASAFTSTLATFVIGGTTSGAVLTLTGGQLAAGVLALGALALVKGALAAAYLYDRRRGISYARKGRRGKRDATEIDFVPMFEAIDAQDADDCGKLLVCHSFAKPAHLRNGEEKSIVNLFDDITVIQHNAYGKFQWAAYAGTFQNPTICLQRYSKCSLNVEALANMIQIQ